jgi:hypothetical protein
VTFGCRVDPGLVPESHVFGLRVRFYGAGLERLRRRVHGCLESPEKGSLISGWDSSIVPVTCLYDAFVDVGPAKFKLCLSFLPVVAPKKHDIPLAISGHNPFF